MLPLFSSPCHSLHILSFLGLLPLSVWLCLLYQPHLHHATTVYKLTVHTHTHTQSSYTQKWAIEFHFNKGNNKVVFLQLSCEDVVNRGTDSKLTRRCYLPSTQPNSTPSWVTQPSSFAVAIKHVNLSSSKSIFSDPEQNNPFYQTLLGNLI